MHKMKGHYHISIVFVFSCRNRISDSHTLRVEEYLFEDRKKSLFFKNIRICVDGALFYMQPHIQCMEGHASNARYNSIVHFLQ